MATPQQLADLQAARGLELDDLFTQLMIEHHAGGIHMAQYAQEHARLERGALPSRGRSWRTSRWRSTS